eukprot:GHVO01067276.1.p1 GENE.GHVO01067276.1~~GHVO01067276.1.p1  ORF type:complete len:163 (+),score=31.05 GHVO01067276.1:277-765(+)
MEYVGAKPITSSLDLTARMVRANNLEARVLSKGFKPSVAWGDRRKDEPLVPIQENVNMQAFYSPLSDLGQTGGISNSIASNMTSDRQTTGGKVLTVQMWGGVSDQLCIHTDTCDEELTEMCREFVLSNKLKGVLYDGLLSAARRLRDSEGADTVAVDVVDLI